MWTSDGKATESIARGMLMIKRFMEKMPTVVLAILIAASSLTVPASCAGKNVTERREKTVTNTEKIYLITDDMPNCSMIISDETFSYLNQNDDYSYILDLMNDYFNVVINDEIEENVVYIKAVSEKIDAEVRLAQVYEPSNKATVLIQIAEAGKSAFNEHYMDDTEDGKKEDKTSDNTNNKLINQVKSSLKKIADKGSVYSVNAIKNEFKEMTNQIYRKSDNIIKDKNVDTLKYNDYYIDTDNENGITIVCGSQETVVKALDYFLTEYVSMGTSLEGDYSISAPESAVHVGHYLSDTIGSASVSKFNIVYYCDSTYYDSRDNAKYLKQYFLKNYGVDLPVIDTDGSYTNANQSLKYKIIIGRSRLAISEKYYSELRDIMDYRIVQQGDNLYCMGGSDLAIRYALDYMINEFFSNEKPVPYGFVKEGNISGESVFPRYGDASVRIMSNNVWFNKLGNTWGSLGFDSSNQTRYREMAKLYVAYSPDVIAFQELYPSSSCSDFMLKEINNNGRNYQYVDGAREFFVIRNHTPMIYNTETLDLLDSGSHVFAYASNTVGSNIGTKSYTWGYFREKATGYKFVVFSTHLWWMKESAKEGSTQWRIDQMTEICKKANELIKEYSCTCFVLGDFNCKTSAKEFSTMSRYKFSDCHDIATEYASNSSGRYICNNTSFSYKPNAGTYKKNGIDHILVKNLKKARILSYNYALHNFYGKLSDHAPVFIDVRTRKYRATA